MKKLVRNRIKCNLCGDVIESKHRYDFVTCRWAAYPWMEVLTMHVAVLSIRKMIIQISASTQRKNNRITLLKIDVMPTGTTCFSLSAN